MQVYWDLYDYAPSTREKERERERQAERGILIWREVSFITLREIILGWGGFQLCVKTLGASRGE